MLEWAEPLWVIALPVALVLPWISRRPTLAFSTLGSAVSGLSLRRALAWLPNALASLGLILLVVALARPQLVNREQVVEHEGIDIMLVLDTSGSMEAEDYTLGGRSTSRIEVAKEVIARFVEGRPNDRVGLVVFGEQAFTQVPLTLDHDSLVGFLRQVRIGMAGERATAVGDAVAVAGKRLKDLEAESRVMILLTDGRNNAGQIEPLQVAEAVASLGVKVYTIGVGTTGGTSGGLFGALMGGRAELDEKTLKSIARITGAEYFRATNTQGLEKVYATIDEMERSTAEVEVFVHREELYHTPLGAGLVVLLLQLILSQTVLRRLP